MKRSQCVMVHDIKGNRGWICPGPLLPPALFTSGRQYYWLSGSNITPAAWIVGLRGRHPANYLPIGHDSGGCRNAKPGIAYLLAEHVEPHFEPDHNEWGETSP